MDELNQLAPTLFDLFVTLGDTKRNSNSTDPDETETRQDESTVFSFDLAKCVFPGERLSAIH